MEKHYSIKILIFFLYYASVITHGQEKPINSHLLNSYKIDNSPEFHEDCRRCSCGWNIHTAPMLFPNEAMKKSPAFDMNRKNPNTLTPEYIELKKLNELLEEKVSILEKELAELRKHK